VESNLATAYAVYEYLMFQQEKNIRLNYHIKKKEMQRLLDRQKALIKSIQEE